MPKVIGFLLLSLVFLAHGCVGDGTTAGQSPPLAPIAPATSSLKVRLDLSAAPPADPVLSSFPINASRFVVEVRDLLTGDLLGGPVTLERNDAAPLETKHPGAGGLRSVEQPDLH